MIPRLLLVAGGTGGHIMPAIALGRWIAGKHPGTVVSYACGARALEVDIYSSAGIIPQRLRLVGSPLAGGISPGERLDRLISMASSVVEARRILKWSSPDCCILFGGYVSLPFLIMCRIMKIPVAVHEQNACAGMVTRLADKLGTPLLTGWEVCFPLRRERFTRVGVPVRDFRKMERAAALSELGVDMEAVGRFTAVVFSGSLGSAEVREKIVRLSAQSDFKAWAFLLSAASGKVEKIGGHVWALPKLWDPSALFAAADCIITRGGGSTLAEAAVQGLPALLIPWRGASGDHQYHNAAAFAAENGGLIVESEGDQRLFAEKLLLLRELSGSCVQDGAFRQYNKADKICEQFWEAIVSQI